MIIALVHQRGGGGTCVCVCVQRCGAVGVSGKEVCGMSHVMAFQNTVSLLRLQNTHTHKAFRGMQWSAIIHCLWEFFSFYNGDSAIHIKCTVSKANDFFVSVCLSRRLKELSTYNMERTITILGTIDNYKKAESLISSKLRASYESDMAQFIPVCGGL